MNEKFAETENELLNFQIESADEGKRLDVFLAEKIEGWSRSRLRKLIENEDVLVNSKTAKNSYKLQLNDEIEIELAVPEAENFAPEDIPLDIIFEDDDIAVINKSSGMVVHPGAGISGGTLANAVAFRFNNQSSNSQFRVGIVHRLDKDTSGLIIVAKNEKAHEYLSDQFRNRLVYKSYLALVHGDVEGESGKIDEPLGRDRSNRLKMAIIRTGRNALSLWKVRQRFERFSLLQVEIKTGRTHQIRVHLASIKHGVVGDETYNGGRDKTIRNTDIRREIAKLNRFFLHAENLGIKHPKTEEYMKFHAPLPKELTDLVEFLSR